MDKNGQHAHNGVFATRARASLKLVTAASMAVRLVRGEQKPPGFAKSSRSTRSALQEETGNKTRNVP